MKPSAHLPGRRHFMTLVAAGAVLGSAACSSCRVPGPSETGSAAPGPLPDVPLKAGRPYTVTELLSTPSFYIAHRGSGDNWPEHTMRAYTEATALGLKAIEVSAVASNDGVLLCHHDLNTFRMTGIELDISRASYAALEGLRVDARAWLGPATALEPLPRLDEVLAKFAASHVIFLEDKQGSNTEAILALLEQYPGAREHIVWKQPATSLGHVAARGRGYTTWGYFGSAELETAPAFFDRVDLLGVPASAPDPNVKEFVGTGKPVIGWEVHRRSERDRLLRLGVRGMMCSNVPYVLQRFQPAARDTFGLGTRAAGDLPWKADSDWQEQPAFTGDGVLFTSESASAYTLGSMGPVTAPGWVLSFELRWPGVLPPEGSSAGIAFGLADDSPPRPGVPPPSGGYRLDVGPDGAVVLERLDAGQSAATHLASGRGAAAVSGGWQRLQLAVTPQEIRVGAPDAAQSGWSIASLDTAFRGGYIALVKNYEGGPPVEFRNVTVGELTAAEWCIA